MTNTKPIHQQVLEKVNRTRKREYARIKRQIKRLTLIDILIRDLINQLESDPLYLYGNEPFVDCGPYEPDQSIDDDEKLDDIDPAAEDMPAYTPPVGCENCAFRDFSPET